jgi:hypothetical protein
MTIITTYNDSHKTCSKCKELLPMEQFSKASGGNYRRSECKNCERELNKVRKKLKEDAPSVPKKYRCPICKRTEELVKDFGGKKSGAWCLDHNHKTHTFRGWLCHQCNRGLGALNDDIERLKSAIRYLEETQ